MLNIRRGWCKDLIGDFELRRVDEGFAVKAHRRAFFTFIAQAMLVFNVVEYAINGDDVISARSQHGHGK